MLGMTAKPKNPISLVPSTNEQFSVRILASSNMEDFSKIIFPTKLVKDAYVKDEYTSLIKDYISYWGAGTLQERAKAFALLSAKRIVFAKSRGYGPSKLRPKEWKLQSAPKPTVA